MNAQTRAEGNHEILEAIYHHEPEATSPLDNELYVETLRRIGLPRVRSERWKYTNPNRLIDELLTPQSTSTQVRVRGGAITLFEFKDAHVPEHVRNIVDSVLDHESHPFTCVNGILCQKALIVDVRHESSPQELTISASSDDVEKFVIVVHEHSELRIHEQGVAKNRVIECIVKPHANVSHFRLQPYDESVSYNHTVVGLDEQASYQFSQSSTGGRLRRNEVVVNLNGQGASANLTGGWKVRGNEHIDNQVTINHHSPQCKSRQTFRGYAQDHGTSIFNGRIYIAPGAQGTDANLNNKNLADGIDAAVYTKPELEIYSDDVVCSHGAATGQLSLDEIFYLKSRGIDHETAKRMLVNGFLRVVVDSPDGEKLLGLS